MRQMSRSFLCVPDENFTVSKNIGHPSGQNIDNKIIFYLKRGVSRLFLLFLSLCLAFISIPINAGVNTGRACYKGFENSSGYAADIRELNVGISPLLSPVAVCKNITVFLGHGGTVSLSGSDIDGGSYDPDGLIVSLEANPSSLDCSNIGNNNVILTVTDDEGLVSTCSATVTVRDNTPPQMNCKNITVWLDHSGSAKISPADLDNGSSDNCGGLLTLYTDRTLFTCSDIGSPTTVTLTGTDASGNTASCTSTVTVQDTTAPYVSVKTFTLSLQPDGTGTLQPSDVDNGSSDNCGPVTLSVFPNTFTCGDCGSKTVILTATDSYGNSSSRSVDIVIEPSFKIESLALNNCDLAVPYALYKANITGADSLYSYFWDGLEDWSKPFLSFISVPPYLVPTNTSTLQTPFFNNATLPDGTYHLRLIVTDTTTGCVDTAEMAITKTGPVFNNITARTSEACEGATEIYSVNSDSGAVYSWDIENGIILSAETDSNRIEVQWNLGVPQGIVKTTINRPNFAGDPCISYVIDTVTIHPVSLPVFNTSALNACSGTEYTYTLTESYPSVYWNVTGGIVRSGGSPSDNFITVIWNKVPTGRITVTSENSYMCPASTFIDVSIDNLSGYVESLSNILCNGASDGEVTVAATPGSGLPPYQYSLDGGAFVSDGSFTGLSLGNHVVTIRDAGFCLFEVPFIITQPPVPLYATTTTTNVDCYGSSTGSADLTVTGGTAPYTFLWSNGAVTEDISNVPAGVYSVTITDANSCTTTATATVLQPAAPLEGTLAVTDVDCYGSFTGAIILTVTGGTAPYSYLWNNGATTKDIIDLAAGDYSVTITDANSCIVTVTGSVNQPLAPLYAGISATDVACFGEATGALNLTVTGGTEPYSYLWNNGATTKDLINVHAGVYNVTVTDANMCTTTASATVIEPAQPLNGIVAVTDVACYGDASGSVDLTVTGGTPPYTFLWSNGAMTEDLVNVPPGVYTVTITDANLCTIVVSGTVNQPVAPLTGNIVATDVACFGDATGGLNLTVSGGTEPYSYLWSNGATTEDLENVTAGNYSVTITDANSCIVTVTGSVTQPLAALYTGITATDVACFGETTGALNLTITGGTEPYSYLWSNGATTKDLINISAGEYNVTVTDANMCTTTASATVIEPAQPLNGIVAVTDVACYGDASGSVDLTVTGGTPPYTFLWSNGAMTEDLVNVAAGVYTVIVTDANLCTTIVSGTVNQPDAPLTGNIVATDVACFGDATGGLNLTVTGGTGPYTYLWSNGAATEDLENVSAGVYNVTVTDANLCFISLSATVNQPAAALDATTTVTDVTCYGDTDGAIDLSITGGTAPYSVLWSNGETTEDIENIVAGVYSVTITDASLCTATVTATVTQPPELIAAAGNNGPVCIGTPISLSGGPDGMASYSWSGPDGFTSPLQNPVVSGSALLSMAGVYTLNIIDNNGCMASATTDVTVNDNNTITLSSPPGSDNQSVCINAAIDPVTYTTTGATGALFSGLPEGVTGSWSGSVVTISGMPSESGIFDYTITLTGGCGTISVNGKITVLEFPVSVTITVDANPVCEGTLVSFMANPVNGGSSPDYQWQVNGIDAGTNSPSFSYIPLDNDEVTVILTSDATCATDNPATSLPVNMIVIPTPVLVINDPAPVCSPATVDITVPEITNGSDAGLILSYWLDAAASLPFETPAEATDGTYYIKAVDPSGCFDIKPVEVVVNPVPSVTFTQTNILCGGTSTGAIDITVTGGTEPYFYSWTGSVVNPAEEDQADLPAGSYSVIVTDVNSCSSTGLSVTITELPALTGAIVSQTNVSVSGGNDGSVTVEGSGGTPPYLYSQDGSPYQASATFSSLTAGNYTITIQDINLCEFSLPVIITEPGLPLSGTILSQTDVLCHGETTGSITVSGIAGEEPYEYSLDGVDYQASGTFEMLSAGPCTVIIRDALMDTYPIDIFINEPAEPLLVTATKTDAVCGGESSGTATATATGGTPPYTYSWNTVPIQTGANASGLAEGTYTVTVTDANGCTAGTDIVIMAPPVLTVTVNSNDILCHGENNGSATATASGGTEPYAYSWNTSPVQTTQTVTDLAQGSYTVTVTDANGCIAVETVNITDPDPLSAEATVTDASCPDTDDGEISLEVTGGTPPYTFIWSDPGSVSSPDRTNLTPGTYSVVISDANGCRMSTSIEVGYTGSYECLVIPDIITPNGDGHNDEWIIQNIDIYPQAEILIYSRWGRLIYRTKNISENPWNGQYQGNGDMMPTDSYHYILHLNDGSTKPRSGVISVIR